jgi:nucleotide-binding universal stress UspA family protein
MLETILVATDGSHYAGRAVELASYLAAKSDAKLIVLHVHPRETSEELRRMAEAEHMIGPAADMSGPAAAPSAPVAALGTSAFSAPRDELSRDAIEAVGRQILESANETAKQTGVGEVRTIAQDGDPARAILDCAKREKPDMIVMGRRGLSDLQGLLMGSVSHKVSHLADCACLTVK